MECQFLYSLSKYAVKNHKNMQHTYMLGKHFNLVYSIYSYVILYYYGDKCIIFLFDKINANINYA